MNPTKEQLEKSLNWIAVKFWFWAAITVATIAATAWYFSTIAHQIGSNNIMFATTVMRVAIGALGLGVMLIAAPLMTVAAYRQGEQADNDLKRIEAYAPVSSRRSEP